MNSCLVIAFNFQTNKQSVIKSKIRLKVLPHSGVKTNTYKFINIKHIFLVMIAGSVSKGSATN